MNSLVHIAVEGLTDEYVVRRVLQFVSLNCGYVRGREGKPRLIANLQKYNQAARFANWLVLLDLDQDADCAPTYVQSLLPKRSEGILLRIPMRAIEAWLLADRERIADFLGIAIENVPLNPDAEANPKATLVNLARRRRKTTLRDDIVPRPNSGASVGPGYASRILEFVEQSENRWRPDVAMENSDSLRRCIAALQNWKLIGAD